MDAVQAMTGSGGWPLNVFLTPDARPFYGGTYFPPTRAYNRASWQETLLGVTQAFRDRRNEIEAQASNLTEHLVNASSFGIQTVPGPEIFDRVKIRETAEQLLKQADKEWGGFGKAPKFPQTFSIQYLLRFHYLSGDGPALEQALLSLDKMIEGGIYDQLGGGFARYSTDTEWLAPHFEKMLYDNALLVMVLSEAYQLTGKLRYREVIEETIDFIQRELMLEEGAFYAALDADSEGVEGKFYVWQPEEIQAVLDNEAELFCAYYDVTDRGTGPSPDGCPNILRVKKPLADFAKSRNEEEAIIKKRLEAGCIIFY